MILPKGSYFFQFSHNVSIFIKQPGIPTLQGVIGCKNGNKEALSSIRGQLDRKSIHLPFGA